MESSDSHIVLSMEDDASWVAWEELAQPWLEWAFEASLG